MYDEKRYHEALKYIDQVLLLAEGNEVPLSLSKVEVLSRLDQKKDLIKLKDFDFMKLFKVTPMKKTSTQIAANTVVTARMPDRHRSYSASGLVFFAFILVSQIAAASSMQKLYMDVMDAKYRTEQPSETEESFKVHLKDTHFKFPDFFHLELRNIAPFSGTRRIDGKITYVQAFQAPYKYTVIHKNNEYILHVKVGFLNASAEDFKSYKTKFANAERIWNAARIPMDFNYSFKFDLMEDSMQADFQVMLQNNTRGPYFLFWGRNWDDIVVAHELGHMLGLGDEYETMTSATRCLADSIMCTNSRRSFLMKHHFYFVLRRLMEHY